MPKCSKCGKALEENATQCPECGQAVEGIIDKSKAVKAKATRTLQFGPAASVTEKPQTTEPELPKADKTPSLAQQPPKEVKPQPVQAKPTSMQPIKTTPPAPAPPAVKIESVKGKATRTLQFGPDAATTEKPKPIETAALPAMAIKLPPPPPGEVKTRIPAAAFPVRPPVEKAPAPQRPIVKILKGLIRKREFWLGLGAVVFLFVILPWGMQRLGKIHKPLVAAQTTPSKDRAVFEALLDKELPDKLVWGREIMHRIIPNRFPEELILEADKVKAEIKFDGKNKSQATYQIPVTYHLLQANPLTFIWRPVTFEFKLQDGQWILAGERWLREDEMIFE